MDPPERAEHAAQAVMLPLSKIMAEWRPGSAEWSWAEEFADIAGRDAAGLARLATEVQETGRRDPLLLGDDGRVWDGHHRILVAYRLGILSWPVEYGTHECAEGI